MIGATSHVNSTETGPGRGLHDQNPPKTGEHDGNGQDAFIFFNFAQSNCVRPYGKNGAIITMIFEEDVAHELQHAYERMMGRLPLTREKREENAVKRQNINRNARGQPQRERYEWVEQYGKTLIIYAVQLGSNTTGTGRTGTRFPLASISQTVELPHLITKPW